MKQNLVTQPVMGWDIGGAHLKAVLVGVDGCALAAKQVYCPLWRGLHELEHAIDTVLSDFNAHHHLVTMTGELADIFQNRHAGVVQIAQTLHRRLSQSPKINAQVKYYAGNQGFVTIEAVGQYTADIASMNWLASVQYVAQNAQQALFIDIGSTTTDIALISNGKVLVRGFNDAARMQLDELVYTGVVRTPLMALAQKIPFAGQLVNVAAECFATSADIYTLTGDLAQADNIAETADGAEKSIEASARRIARMIGHDALDAPLSAWHHLAHAFKHAQLNLIKQAVFTQMSQLKDCRNLSIIGAGAGEFMAGELARQLGVKYASASDFIHAESDTIKNRAKVSFPAYAVACLGLKS